MKRLFFLAAIASVLSGCTPSAVLADGTAVPFDEFVVSNRTDVGVTPCLGDLVAKVTHSGKLHTIRAAPEQIVVSEKVTLRIGDQISIEATCFDAQGAEETVVRKSGRLDGAYLKPVGWRMFGIRVRDGQGEDRILIGIPLR